MREIYKKDLLMHLEFNEGGKLQVLFGAGRNQCDDITVESFHYVSEDNIVKIYDENGNCKYIIDFELVDSIREYTYYMTHIYLSINREIISIILN